MRIKKAILYNHFSLTKLVNRQLFIKDKLSRRANRYGFFVIHYEFSFFMRTDGVRSPYVRLLFLMKTKVNIAGLGSEGFYKFTKNAMPFDYVEGAQFHMSTRLVLSCIKTVGQL